MDFHLLLVARRAVDRKVPDRRLALTFFASDREEIDARASSRRLEGHELCPFVTFAAQRSRRASVYNEVTF